MLSLCARAGSWAYPCVLLLSADMDLGEGRALLPFRIHSQFSVSIVPISVHLAPTQEMLEGLRERAGPGGHDANARPVIPSSL